MTVRRNPCRQSIYVLPLLIALSVSALAADPLTVAKGDVGRMKISAFGKLPVRFNGQVTTFGAVAPIMLTKLSGRDFFIDADGQKQSAVRWLLDVITDSADAEEHKVVPIQNPQLLTMLGFDEDPRVRRYRASGKNTKPPKVLDPPRFGLAELRPKFELINKETKRILMGVKSDDYNDFQSALSDLRTQYDVFITIMTGLQSILDLTDIEVAERVVQELQLMDPHAFFQMVPAPEAKGQWQTTLRAAIELHTNEISKKEPNFAALSLKAIFDAYRNKEADNFNRRLSAYRKWAKRNAATRSPVSFTVPKTWRETGVCLGKGNGMFNSVLANGDNVAVFDIGEGKQQMMAFLRHFTGKTMPDTEIYNDWRIGFGLMPLSESELAKIGTPITISGHKVFYLDFIPSKEAEIDTSLIRIVGTVIRHGNHTFVINAGLPKVVTHHKRTFESFATSLEFASAEDLSRWFPESQPLQPHERRYNQTTAVALVPDGPRLWSFRLIEYSKGKEENSPQLVFEKLVRSISPLEGNPKAGIQWADPEDWRRDRPGDQPVIYYPQNRTTPARIVVMVVGGAVNADRLPLVNLWRIQTGLPAWKQEQMVKASEELQVAGRTVTLFKFETRPASALPEIPTPQTPTPQTPTPQTPKSELTYQVPKGWDAGKAGVLRTASFLIRDDDKQADVSVVVLPLRANWLAANVNRWRGQVKLDALDEAAIRESVKKIAVAGNTGHYIDIPGTGGSRIVAVIVVRGKELWFFKMMGDDQLVGEQKGAFEAFVKSASFKDVPPK